MTVTFDGEKKDPEKFLRRGEEEEENGEGACEY